MPTSNTDQKTPKELLDDGDVTYPSPDVIVNPDADRGRYEGDFDLPKKTIRSLGSWMSSLTGGKQFRTADVPYGTDPQNVALNTYSESDDQIVVRTMTASDTDSRESMFDRSLNRQPSDDVPGLKKGFRRLGQPDGLSGNEYLKSAQVNDQGIETSSGLVENSLSSVVEDYIVNGSRSDVSHALKNNRFTYSTPARSENDPIRIKGVDRSFQQLINIGSTLTARASGEMSSADGDYDAASAGAEGKAILPGWVQLATSPVDLTVMDAITALNDSVGTGAEEESILAPSVSGNPGSYGQMNNPLDQYTGMSAFGMAALSISLFVATTVVIEGFATLLGIFMKGGFAGSDNTRYGDGNVLILGTHGARTNQGTSGGFPPLPLDSSVVANLLGLREGQHEWKDAVEAGFLRFYGSSETSLSASGLSDSIVRALESPGYYSVVSRSIIRSGVGIIQNFKDIFKAPNIFAVVKDVMRFFETIKNSKFIGALNMFAAIGEAVLSNDLNSAEYDKFRDSLIDSIDNNESSMGKSRLKDHNNNTTHTLAWSSNRALSMVITSRALRDSLTQNILPGAPGVVNFSPSNLSRTVTVDTMSRLPADAVEYIENVLESEYVPFYFQDIRTNEIVSFHAFITSLSDDYSVNWESMEAMGRVDPTKVYKNTIRKIGMGFIIASTSDDDFQEMWLKINKLTTLIYPQFTKGRTVSVDDNNKFILPFSQVQSASPLIRIRLGDLIKSNYSRFALARLFGAGSQYVEDAGTDTLKIDGTSLLPKKNNSNIQQKVTELRQPDTKKVTGVVYSVSTYDEIPHASIKFTGPDLKTSYRFDNLIEILHGMNVYSIPVNIIEVDDKSKLVKVRPVVTGRVTGYYTLNQLIFLKVFTEIVDYFYISNSRLSVSQSEMNLYIRGVSNTSSEDTGKISKFFSPDSNSIFRAFKETGGRGLAGVIESMNFDWYDRVTWSTDGVGIKAPKMCKVTISFSPIHDITPGLDHNGYNRSQIYPVGINGVQPIAGAAVFKTNDFSSKIEEGRIVTDDSLR